MKFCIRDDDLNYFSSPEDVARWYGDLFSEQVPIGFSTIPFVTGESDVYTAGFGDKEKKYSIHENQALTTYVRSQPLMEIMQHGVTHETVSGLFEFKKESGLEESLLTGKNELEQAFETQVKIFVAPHDQIGRHGINVVEKAGMNIIRGYEIDTRHVIPRIQDIPGYVAMEMHRLKYFRDKDRPAYPHILKFGKHKEVCSYRLEHKTVFDGLEYVAKENGVFVIVAHIHTMNKEAKDKLRALVSRARELNATFVKPSDLFT